MRQLCCLEMSGTSYVVMQHHIPEEIPHPQHCKILETHINSLFFLLWCFMRDDIHVLPGWSGTKDSESYTQQVREISDCNLLGYYVMQDSKFVPQFRATCFFHLQGDQIKFTFAHMIVLQIIKIIRLLFEQQPLWKHENLTWVSACLAKFGRAGPSLEHLMCQQTGKILSNFPQTVGHMVAGWQSHFSALHVEEIFS